MTSLPRIYSLDEAASYLRLTPELTAAKARRGEIPSRKSGRLRVFTEDDLATYLESIRVGRESGRPVRRRRAG